MKIYSLIATLIFVGGSLVAMQQRHIVYADLINRQSEIWSEMRGLVFAERVKKIMGNAREIMLKITDVPGLKLGELTTISVVLDGNAQRLEIYFFDEQGQQCVEGVIKPAHAHLKYLMTTPVSGSLCSFFTKKRGIAGNTAMRIWDAFWMFCASERAVLEDYSQCDGLELRVLLPYVYGCSWYGTFGYRPTSNPLDYDRALTALVNRSCKKIITGYGHSREILSVFMRAFELCHVASEDITIGSLVTELYARWKQGSLECKKCLKILYDYCLNTTYDLHDRALIHYIKQTRSFEKNRTYHSVLRARI